MRSIDHWGSISKEFKANKSSKFHSNSVLNSERKVIIDIKTINTNIFLLENLELISIYHYFVNIL